MFRRIGIREIKIGWVREGVSMYEDVVYVGRKNVGYGLKGSVLGNRFREFGKERNIELTAHLG